jgi:uncharacterized protein with PIN domain
MDTTFVRSCVPDGPLHHEVLIGVATSVDGRIRRFGGVIAALDPPHRPIADALGGLGRGPDTTITAFSNAIGDKALDAAMTHGNAVGHQADLNLGDCFAYACAKAYRMRLIYKGDDFARTDLA